MTKKIIECFFGVVISVAVILIALMIFVSFVTNFPLSEEWKLIEIQKILPFLIFTLVFTFSLLFGLKYWRANKKHLAISITIFPFIVICIVTFATIDKLNYRKPFNEKEWNKSELKDGRIAITLFQDKKLLGLSREELLIKLGNPDKKHDSKQTNASTLFYWVERNWELIIYLENESVIDVKFKKIKS